MIHIKYFLTGLAIAALVVLLALIAVMFLFVNGDLFFLTIGAAVTMFMAYTAGRDFYENK